MKKTIAFLVLSTVFMASCKDKVVDTIETTGTDNPQVENVTPQDSTSTELTPTEAEAYETATGDELN